MQVSGCIPQGIGVVHSAGFEDQVFAVHVGQGQDLRTVIERHDRDDGVGACAGPGHAEGIGGSRHLQHHVRAAVVGVPAGKRFHLVWQNGKHPGIMPVDKRQPDRVRIADDDEMLPRPAQCRVQQGVAPDLCAVRRTTTFSSGGNRYENRTGMARRA